jgi:type VI secretion system protein ImpA
MTAGVDSQALLQPISAEQPCGENLEDTPLLASFDPFRVFGELRPPDDRPDKKDENDKSKPPEWTELRSLAAQTLTRSKDLRVLAHLAAAQLRTDGFPAFAETLGVAARWLESYWPQVYPLVDEDAMLRRNALNCFADPMAILDRIRRMPLTDSRQYGRFALRDVEIAAGQLAPSNGDARPEEAHISAAFVSTSAETIATLESSLRTARTAIAKISDAMATEGGPEAVPAFDLLSTYLGRIAQVIGKALGAREETIDSPIQAATAPTSVPAAPVVVEGAPGVIRSRQDAIRALDAVAEFFRVTEPSSPVPMFLARAKRLVDKDFLEVLADIAPEALDKARAAGGLTGS